MSHREFNDPHGKSVEARQALLDNRCEHGPKRHRTIGRKRRIAAAKKRRIAHVLAVKKAAYAKYLDASRAYWRGNADAHP